MRAAPLEFREFTGINNVSDVHRLKKTELARAVNVEIDETRALGLRPGRGAVLASTDNAHSLFQHEGICLYRRGTDLYRLHADHTSVLLKSGLTAGARMFYADAPGRIFMGDGFSRLWTDGEQVRDWGIVPPGVQPAASQTGGALPVGKYLFAVTFLRDDGEESGTGEAGAITLSGPQPQKATRGNDQATSISIQPDGTTKYDTAVVTHGSGRAPSTNVRVSARAGISFSSIPVSAQADVTMKAIYLTQPNGTKLFRAMVIGNATTSASYTAGLAGLRTELETQFLREPPAGRVLLHYNGRMLVGDGRYLWYTPNPYQLERFSRLAVRPYSAVLTGLARVDDGVFVLLEDRIDFHAGPDFAQASVATKTRYGGCPGGVTYLEGDQALNGIAGRVAVMMTRRGVCFGSNGGAFQAVTDGRYLYPNPQSVTAAVRQLGGYAQIIALLRY